tara:strand:+ start:1974 stop:2252 length:279 start_codon:yes stop_codon:yes gene_type:complete
MIQSVVSQAWRRKMKQTASLLLTVFLLGGFFFMLSIKPAHAYIELASVSFFLQMLVAGAFGLLFGLKMYWNKVTGYISRLFALIRRFKPTSE